MDIDDINKALWNLDNSIASLEIAWVLCDSETDRLILLEQIGLIKQIIENLDTYFFPKTNTSAS
jgi:hypothetical protein